MNPALLAELRADGVTVADNASLDETIDALQQRIVRLVTSVPSAYDRAVCTRLMRAWEELTAERAGEDS
jgi:hypothetical protein